MLSSPSLITATDNLLLLSRVATALLPKRNRRPNPVCNKPGHAKQKPGKGIQRHTCSSCFRERAAELFANPHITRWDVSCILVREFRNYFCCCCILEADPANLRTTVCHTRSCRRGHSFICKERRCVPHKQRLTLCTKCIDPRAGTSYHPSGCHRLHIKCDCKQPTLEAQDPDVVEKKRIYAANMLKRAREMQEAGVAVETESDSHGEGV
jgi:hypothetical protein